MSDKTIEMLGLGINVNKEFCNERHENVNKQFNSLSGEVKELKTKMETGFEKIDTRINSAEETLKKGMINILIKCIVLLGGGFVTMGLFIIYSYATGNLKVVP